MIVDPSVLLADCAHCGGQTELQFESWKPETSPAKPEEWRCPHCGRSNHGMFPGRVAWAMKFDPSAFRH